MKFIEATLEFQNPTVLYGMSWDGYEELQNLLGDDYPSLRVSFNKGILEIMPKAKHDHYSRLIEQFITMLKARTRQRITFFGSATMKKDELRKGAEADASFFVSRANLVSGNIDFEMGEIPPDVVVEIDVHHASQAKFEIYAALGVAEFWLYDEKELKIYRLNENGDYDERAASVELPILTAAVLTDFLNRSQTVDQTDVVFEFDEWLAKQLQN